MLSCGHAQTLRSVAPQRRSTGRRDRNVVSGRARNASHRRSASRNASHFTDPRSRPSCPWRRCVNESKVCWRWPMCASAATGPGTSRSKTTNSMCA
ncbi:hypothetical protein [Lysobacter gummosus]|uniref:hypothetical protein n=1 Tax=Lysobacter gummosus TaxID=262324 RepID=UPI00362B5BC7